MVQLLDLTQLNIKNLKTEHFNSSIVQLLVDPGIAHTLRKTKFQFQYGAIISLPACTVVNSFCHFNSSMVQLLV